MCKLVVRSDFYEEKRPHPPSQKCSFFHHTVVQNWSETQISPMLFSWEHQKYQNIHPGAHFGTSLGGSWEAAGYRPVAARLLFSPLLFSLESHIIHQNVCNNILHASASSNCEYSIPDLHKNWKIVHFFPKMWPGRTFISWCDMNI